VVLKRYFQLTEVTFFKQNVTNVQVTTCILQAEHVILALTSCNLQVISVILQVAVNKLQV
jgi:hypothetical protein